MHRRLGSVDLFCADDQRRHEADRVLVDGVDDETSLEARLLERFGVRLGELRGLHEPEPSHLFGAEPLKDSVQQLAHLGGVADKAVALAPRKVEIKGSPRSGPMPHNGYRPFDVSACRAAFPDFRYTSLADGLRLATEGERR